VSLASAFGSHVRTLKVPQYEMDECPFPDLIRGILPDYHPTLLAFIQLILKAFYLEYLNALFRQGRKPKSPEQVRSSREEVKFGSWHYK